jgi:hypothetical protein
MGGGAGMSIVALCGRTLYKRETSLQARGELFSAAMVAMHLHHGWQVLLLVLEELHHWAGTRQQGSSRLFVTI